MKPQLAMLLLALAGCTDRAPREQVSCPRVPHIDSTGHTVICACVCESNPDAECPLQVAECRDELGTSSSEGSSSE